MFRSLSKSRNTKSKVEEAIKGILKEGEEVGSIFLLSTGTGSKRGEETARRGITTCKGCLRCCLFVGEADPTGSAGTYSFS